jgi:ferrous iron transport protein B
MRAAHREAERILKATVKPPERPDTFTGKMDDVLLHPVWGLLILATILFLMFQAVFSWATPIMDLIEAAFTLPWRLGRRGAARRRRPPSCCAASSSTA